MSAPEATPYGGWPSPVSALSVAGAAVRLGSLAVDGDDLYWVEGRPEEAGRNVIVRRTPDGTVADVTPPPFNARTRVHEYGGGDFAVAGGRVVFANFADQRLYGLNPGGAPGQALPLTPDSDAPGGPRLRYADLVFDPLRRRLICIREDHTGVAGGAPETGGPPPQAQNAVVAVDLAEPSGDARQRVLVSGNDFYAAPRLSPDGRRLAWLTWNHPNMPWDGTELWTGDLTPDGSIAGSRRVAGGPEESIFQPEWGPDGRLYFVSDRSGWWNLYRLGDGGEAVPLAPRAAEFGVPQWVFGLGARGNRLRLRRGRRLAPGAPRTREWRP
jgi:WD40-like Beta Propeller Repeat